MNIQYLSSSTIPSRDANSIHVMKMSSAFAGQGCNVTLHAMKGDVSPMGERDLHTFYGVNPNYSVRLLGVPAIKGAAYIHGLVSSIRACLSRPDAVYCRDLMAAFVASFFSSVVIYESHSPVSEKGKIASFLFKRMLKRPSFKGVVVITHALREFYVEHYPELKNRILVAPDGADSVVVSKKNTVEQSGAATDTSSDLLRVGYVGHLYPGKGIELIAKLAPLCPWATFDIVGGSEVDIVRWRSRCSGIKNMEFQGFVAHDEVPCRISAYDVVLLPNQKSVTTAGGKGDIGKWTSPLKAFEYMASGKAIVASDLPVLREVLTDGVNCLLCDPEEELQWRSALLRLKRESHFREQLGDRAKDVFEQRYSWSRRAKNCLDFLGK